MKNALLVLVGSLLATSLASADPIRPTVPIKPISPTPSNVPTLRVPPLVLPPAACPDPGVASIDYAILSRTTPFQGRVRITGTVKNLGRAPYVSNPRQQSVLLYEVPAAGPARLVAQRAFQNLAPDEAVTVAFDRDWRSSEEFPPSYRVIISYDPDILLDSNPKNDDCGAANNRRERPGGEISALFR